MINPHGSRVLNALYVDDVNARSALWEEVKTLPKLLLSAPAAANVVMLGGGYFNPLSGFMNKTDALSVAQDLHTQSGLFWPVPILNLTHEGERIVPGTRIALCDPNVKDMPVLAVQEVESVEVLTDKEIEKLLTTVYLSLIHI